MNAAVMFDAFHGSVSVCEPQWSLMASALLFNLRCDSAIALHSNTKHGSSFIALTDWRRQARAGRLRHESYPRHLR